MTELLLPTSAGELLRWRLLPAAEDLSFDADRVGVARRAFAAPHVVADPRRNVPRDAPVLDLDATVAFRRHLWSCGLGVAEAMSTAERGDGGLPWPVARELIAAVAEAAAEHGGNVACGIGSEALVRADSLAEIRDEYLRELRYVEERGVPAIIRGGPRTVELAGGFDDYAAVYGAVLDAAQLPVIIHWVGEPFNPVFRDYWGTRPDEAVALVAGLAEKHADALDGIKFSLLDHNLEVRLRRALPPGVRVYTGDDYHYVELIAGDDHGHSDALLGVFDSIAPLAGRALAALADGDAERYRSILAPTEELARTLFAPPAALFKAGTVFLAYLNGHQDHFRMASGQEGARSIAHYAELFVMANRLGLLRDPDDAAARFTPMLRLAGVA